MRLTVVSPGYPPSPGGVSDYARRWALALAETGLGPITVLTRPGAEATPGLDVSAARGDWGALSGPGIAADVRATRPDVVVVHYEPHMYQRRGLSLGVNWAVSELGRDTPVLTIAHELFYGRHEGWRKQPHGLWQRLALRPLVAGSRRFVVTVPDRLAWLEAAFPHPAGRFKLMSVGANLAPADAASSAAWRARLGLPDGTLLLLFLGLGHPSKELGSLEAALDRLSAAGVPARLAVVGGSRVAHPLALNLGFLPAEAAACALGAADMALLPLADGASTRRTSLINALGAGLPVVSTRGANTDAALLDAGCRLVPAAQPDAFAEAVLALARDPEARAALGAAGLRLHDAHFAWPVLAEGWRALLEETAQA